MNKRFLPFLFSALFILSFIGCQNGVGPADASQENLPGVEPAPVYQGETVGNTDSSAPLNDHNLLSNGGFENGMGDWYPFAHASGGELVVTQEEAHRGSSSLYPVPAPNGNSRIMYNVTNQVEDGGAYYLEAWVKLAPGAPVNMVTKVSLGIGQRLRNPRPGRGGYELNVPSVEARSDRWTKIYGIVHLYDDQLIDHSALCLDYEVEQFFPPDTYLPVALEEEPRIYFDDVILRQEVSEYRPFPQREDYPHCIKPPEATLSQRQMEDDIVELYEEWKEEYYRAMEFTGGSQDGDFRGYIIEGDLRDDIDLPGWGGVQAISSSELHGYGMITFALMAGHDAQARECFDQLLRTYINWPSAGHSYLMSRDIPANGDLSMARQPSATAGDLDVAYALLLASDQWGGGPQFGQEISYYDAAIRIIEGLKISSIYDEVGMHFPRLSTGNFGGNYYATRAIRSSEIMPSYMALFYRATGDPIWERLEKTMLEITEYIQHEYTELPHSEGWSGLMPDYMGNQNGDFIAEIQIFEGISEAYDGVYDDDYFYDACTFPLRYALAYAHDPHPWVKLALDRLTDWVIDTKQAPRMLKAGYHLNGEVHRHLETELHQYATWEDDSFTAPVTAALMSSDDSDLLEDYWRYIAEYDEPDTWGVNSTSNSIKLLSMLLISGNWWEPSGSKNSGGVISVPEYPQWTTNRSYAVGSIVEYDDQTWINSFAHTSNIAWYPGAPGLWFWEIYQGN